MRIVSDGTTLRAYYRFAGEPWTQYGEPAALASVPNPKVGVYANDSNATVTSRDDAVFDYFRIAAGAAGHDRRRRRRTRSRRRRRIRPAGWYRQNVDGDARDRGGRHDRVQGRRRGLPGLQRRRSRCRDEGTNAVTYRSRDVEGNVEADKTVTVKIDKTVADLGGVAGRRLVHRAGHGDAGGRRPAGGPGSASSSTGSTAATWTTYATPVTVSGNGQRTRSSTARRTWPATWAPSAAGRTRSRAAADPARRRWRRSPTRRPARRR